MRQMLFTIAIPGLLVATSAGVCAENATQKPWEVVAIGNGSIAVPREWRNTPVPKGTMILHRQGDGIMVPALDETGAPLQIGLMVEKYPGTEDSLAQGVQGLLETVVRNPRLKLLNKEIVEDLKLSDNSDAKLLTTVFVKEGTRRSLQMKMLVKDAQSNGWVISGFMVAGKESGIPSPDSEIAKWLRAHLVSFCLDAKLQDETKLKDAYGTLQKGPERKAAPVDADKPDR